MSLKTERIAIRKLVKELKYWSDVEYCEKNCTCSTCKAIRYAKKEDKKLTETIDANTRARDMYALVKELK